MHTLLVKIFTRKNEVEEQIFQEYCRENSIIDFVDEYKEAAEEVANFRNPSNLFTKSDVVADPKKEEGIWVCYPWRHAAVHTLNQHDYNNIRLSRNNCLITRDEQEILSHATIAIAGLNVGNPVAIGLAQEGVGDQFRYADNDILGISNLNRFRAGLPDLGVNKATLSARQALEINPFLRIDVYNEGLSQQNIHEFLKGANLVIEEMDNLQLKIALREEARTRRIPTVMITGNGPGVILDIERYDIDPNLALLSGYLKPDVRERIFSEIRTPQDKLALARDFMGAEFLNDRLRKSFDEVGKSLIGIPQLAEATFLRGAVLTHVIRMILLNKDVPSGRYMFDLSSIIST